MVVTGSAYVIMGSGFVPGQTVWLTICETDIPFDPEWVEANDCGAFALFTTIPEDCPDGFVSLKAWSGGVGGVLEATWPLYILPLGPR